MAMLVMTLHWLIVIAPAMLTGWFLTGRRAAKSPTLAQAGPTPASPFRPAPAAFGTLGQPRVNRHRALNVVIPAQAPGTALATPNPMAGQHNTIVELVAEFHGPGVSYDVFSVSDGLTPATAPAPEQIRAYLPAARHYVPQAA